MAEEIYMDVPAVKNIAQRFNDMGQHLAKASKGMQSTIAFLKGTAFIGMFGNYAMATYLEQIQPVIEQFSNKCAEMSSDLMKSAEAYERGDAAGATRFY